MLIGMCGRAGTGKDTAAKILVDLDLVTYSYALASPIKRCINALFGWDERHSDGALKEVMCWAPISNVGWIEFKRLVIVTGLSQLTTAEELLSRLVVELVSEGLDETREIWTSPRIAYQVFGTEVGRKIRDTIWLDLAPTVDVVITDVRFPNELDWLRSKGGILIKVEGPRRSKGVVSKHSSESFVDQMVPNMVLVNDSTLESLKNNLLSQLPVALAMS